MAKRYLDVVRDLKRNALFAAEVKIAIAGLEAREKLVRLRESQRISQKELARRMGISQPAVAKLEDPTNPRIRLETIVKTAAALGFELEPLKFRQKPAAASGASLYVPLASRTRQTKPMGASDATTVFIPPTSRSRQPKRH